MKKESSYQKMKRKHSEQVQELVNDIMTLVDERDYVAYMQVKHKWILKQQIEKAILHGSSTETI